MLSHINSNVWFKMLNVGNKHAVTFIFYNNLWMFLICLLTALWCILWNVQTLQLYIVCSPEWNFFMCFFRLLFWIDLLHSLQLIFSLFWWTFLTCLFIFDWLLLWYEQTLQLYRICSTEWYCFMCLFRLFFWIDLLHSLQIIFSLFWWTFLTCLDKLLLIT